MQALEERKEKIKKVEDTTAKVAENASTFSDMATQLARKYAK